MVVTAWIGKKARSFYWIVFCRLPTAQQPALETQPRRDIRRCRGDERSCLVFEYLRSRSWVVKRQQYSPLVGVRHSKEPALQHEHVWSRVGQLLKAKALLPKTALRPARIPLKEAPRPRCFNFFGLTRPFTIRKLRRLVNVVRFPGREDRVKRFRDGTSQSDRKRFWRWDFLSRAGFVPGARDWEV
ncbi:BQ5605_C061g12746 [Microbotryum silenes-dioicae]|uniref:BQ5605_C054g12612 protein n=1 Tax=Microbotryum silenes-dioicae TaxID=796604 RepID=A0A2X0MRE7_9BASI|nr:BQ5605_C054g12612 [Microbotryum silenes-dioicae]SGZ35496.1 BQ5605_C061g12746 [Microbotryum silenes-dioicae]